MKFFKNPLFAARFFADLASMGGGTPGNPEGRVDSNEQAFTIRGLEHIFQQTYDVLYPQLKARSLFPVNTQVPSGANSYTYVQVDKRGEARWITNYANDFTNAEVLMNEFTGYVKAFGSGFSYSVQDLRAAAAVHLGVGMPLDKLRADAARFACEIFLDDVAAYGSTAQNIKGFVTHADIPTVTVSSGGGAWTTALATVNAANNAIIIADLNKLVNTPEQSTLGIETPDTLLLPLSVKPRLTSPMDMSVFHASSLIDHWLKGQDTIKEVVYWSKLDAAQSNGNLSAGTARAMVYRKDPRVVELVEPQPFEMFEPERRGMTFFVACHERTGGITIRYPLACAKMNVGT